MENASKALLMAGGILIALLVIGTLILMFSDISDYQNSKNNMQKSLQIAEFNNQYMPYNKDDLTIMELKTVYNKIMSHNSRNPEIIIEFNGYEGVGDTNNQLGKLGQYVNGARTTIIEDLIINSDFSQIDEKIKMKTSYKCIEITYSNEGYINGITFEMN